MPPIKLKSADNVIFETQEEVVRCSMTIKNLLQTLQYNPGSSIIHLQSVNASILKLVLEWASHHRYETEYDGVEIGLNDSPWDANFLRLDFETLVQLFVAARYLGIIRLLYLTCQAMNNALVGTTRESLRRMFPRSNNTDDDNNPEDHYEPGQKRVKF